MPIESDPNSPRGLYCYDDDTPGRCWRPDLIEVILAWLRMVPELDMRRHFVKFQVGPSGEFVAVFQKAPRRGGPPVPITFMVDHGFTSIANPERVISASLHTIIDYQPDILHAAANIQLQK